jgi:hypothetical protein
MYEAERVIIGASHAEIGAYLLGIGGLPYSIVEAVAHHHDPERVPQPDFDVAALTIALVPGGDADAFLPAYHPSPESMRATCACSTRLSIGMRRRFGLPKLQTPTQAPDDAPTASSCSMSG